MLKVKPKALYLLDKNPTTEPYIDLGLIKSYSFFWPGTVVVSARNSSTHSHILESFRLVWAV